MLHRMTFCLSGKLVGLHLDNRTTIAYLCNEGCTVSHFLSRLAYLILTLTDKHIITLTPTYIPTHLNQEANYLLWGSVAFGVACSPSDGPSSFLPLGSTRGGSSGILPYYSVPALVQFGNTTTLGALGLNTFNHPWTYQIHYVFPPLALVL